MKKISRFLVSLFLVLLIALPAFSATSNSPNKNHSGYLGESGKAWYKSYIDYLYLTGGTGYSFLFTGTPSANRTYTLPDKSGTIAMTSDVSTAAVVITAANAVNKNIRLLNSGDGELAGNASNDTTLSIRVAYRVHTAGL